MANNIEYLEKPATPDEQKIGKILETVLLSIKNHNIDLLGTVLSEDALVSFLEDKNQLTKSEYLRRLAQSTKWPTRGYKLKNVLIRVVNEQEAVISAIGLALFPGAASYRADRRYVLCKKIHGQWLIVKASYC